jgi:YbbR domain-containing protein
VDGKIGIWLKDIIGKGLRSIKHDYIVFFFFLILSFIFWYLNSLGKEIESEIRYPVRFVNLPKGRVLIEELPSKLNLYLKGPGYSILKVKFSGNRAPAVLDISTLSYRRIPGSKTLSYYIKTSDLTAKLKNELRSECQIISIKPDTLFFSFDRIVTKNVPVVSGIVVTTDRQYFIKGDIIIDPDSVKISGPSRILDTVTNIRTKYKKLTGVKETLRKNINLSIPDYIVSSTKKVTLTIPAEQFTEAEIVVPVKILNQSDSIDVKIFPDVVTVKGLVAVTDYKKFEEIPFEVILDLNKVNLNTLERIPLELRNVLPFVTSLRITPPDVDFLIEKKIR